MKQATLKIYAPIDGYGWQLYRVRSFLAEHSKEEVVIEVNSLGGSVNDALMISKEIAEHGNVTVKLLAFCASAVTWMGFGAKKVEIADDALWLCHQSSVLVDIYSSLNADDIERTIEDLQKQKKLAEATDLIIARKYLDKALSNGKETTLAKIIDLMKEEKYLTAQEVVDLGFADEIIKGAKSMTNEVRDFMVQNAAALHMPEVPAMPETEKKGILSRIKDAATKVFSNQEEKEEGVQEDSDPATKQPSNIIMKENFVSVNALLGLTALEVIDGKITLTEEQVQSIENALAQKKASEDAVKDATDALDAISENVKSIEGLKNKVMAVRTVLDHAPLMSPITPTPKPENKDDEEQKKLAESAVDPVNEYVKEM